MSNEIVKFEDYGIVQQGVDKVGEMIALNVGQQGISRGDLDAIKCPASGGQVMMVPTIDGEDAKREIQGIIIHKTLTRRYWSTSYESGGGTPPDCQSDDCLSGRGDPGGDCVECQLAQFGSHDKGRAQACSQIMTIYLLRSDSFLPTMINLPPTSLGNSRKFFLRLSGRMIPYHGVVVNIGLEKAKNEDGVDYSKFTLNVADCLSPEAIQKVKVIRDALVPMLENVRPEDRDFQPPQD